MALSLSIFLSCTSSLRISRLVYEEIHVVIGFTNDIKIITGERIAFALMMDPGMSSKRLLDLSLGLVFM